MKVKRMTLPTRGDWNEFFLDNVENEESIKIPKAQIMNSDHLFVKLTNIHVINKKGERNCKIKSNAQVVLKDQTKSWALQNLDLKTDSKIKYYVFPVNFFHDDESFLPTYKQRNQKYKKNKPKIRQEGRAAGEVIRELESNMYGVVNGQKRKIDLRHTGLLVIRRSDNKIFYVDNLLNCKAYDIFGTIVRTYIVSQIKKFWFRPESTCKFECLTLNKKKYNPLYNGCQVLAAWTAVQLVMGKAIDKIRLPLKKTLLKFNEHYFRH